MLNTTSMRDCYDHNDQGQRKSRTKKQSKLIAYNLMLSSFIHCHSSQIITKYLYKTFRNRFQRKICSIPFFFKVSFTFKMLTDHGYPDKIVSNRSPHTLLPNIFSPEIIYLNVAMVTIYKIYGEYQPAHCNDINFKHFLCLNYIRLN